MVNEKGTDKYGSILCLERADDPTMNNTLRNSSLTENLLRIENSECYPILVFDGLIKYCERLKVHIAIYHHNKCHCYELIIFRQNNRNTVWARFYIMDSSINQQITPSKLKLATQRKIRKRLLCKGTSNHVKVSTQQANVLARYSLVQEFFECRVKDIINFEISRLYLSDQTFSLQLLTDPFDRPVQGRDYSPFIIKLLVTKPEILTPTVVCQDIAPSINRFLQRIKLSNSSYDSNDQYSSLLSSNSDYKLEGNNCSSPGYPSISSFSSLPCRQSSPSILLRSHPLHRQSSQNSIVSCLSTNTPTKDHCLPRVVQFTDHPHSGDEDTHSVQSLPSLGHSADDLSISKFAACFVMSEYEALPPRNSSSQPVLQFDDNLENDDNIESMGIVVEPTVELLSLEPKGVNTRSLAQLMPQELSLNYNFLQEKSKMAHAKQVALEPIFRKSTSPFKCSTSVSSTLLPTSPTFEALSVRSCLNKSPELSLISRSKASPIRNISSPICPIKTTRQHSTLSSKHGFSDSQNENKNIFVCSRSPLRHRKKIQF